MASLAQEIERAVQIATRKAEGEIRRILQGLEHDTMTQVSAIAYHRKPDGDCIVSLSLRK